MDGFKLLEDVRLEMDLPIIRQNSSWSSGLPASLCFLSFYGPNFISLVTMVKAMYLPFLLVTVILLLVFQFDESLCSLVHFKQLLELEKNPDKHMQVLPLLEDPGERDDLSLNQQGCMAVMKVCKRLGQFEIVESLFNWFKQSGQDPSVVMYTTLIHSRFCQKKYREALPVVWELEGMNCLFDFPAYHSFLVALNDLPRTVRYFSKLKEAGFSPTYDIYQNLFTIYMVSGRAAKFNYVNIPTAIASEDKCSAVAMSMYAYDYVDLPTDLKWGPIDKFLVAFRTYNCRPGSFDHKAHLQEPLELEGLFQARKSQIGVVGAHYLPKKAPPLCQDITRPVALAKREVPHLDTTEKQMLLKEVRLSKAKRKEAETETERLRPASESGRERHSLKSMLSKHSVSKSEAFSDGRGVCSNATMASQSGRSRSQSTDFVI
ncbi:hypothetical protein RHMOL_Rhmol12G0218100 [Rhododendron molle]|uniref:Uncharacterized protein n=1 Tax=Rhododendron molle TaxID=49168 RepID=A0ACC0LKV9_RHOML|nr:hypothetical protein RHMOL_Rhmol12G0218100 [Rhododendron molle]